MSFLLFVIGYFLVPAIGDLFSLTRDESFIFFGLSPLIIALLSGLISFLGVLIVYISTNDKLSKIDEKEETA